MAIEPTAQTGYEPLFTLEAPSPKRVRLWAKLAEQASTSLDMRCLHQAYIGCFWELEAIQSLEYISSWLQRGDMAHAANWIGLLAMDMHCAANAWIYVARYLVEQGRGESRWSVDVTRHLHYLRATLEQVCTYGMNTCSLWGISIPEGLSEAHTFLMSITTQEQTSPL